MPTTILTLGENIALQISMAKPTTLTDSDTVTNHGEKILLHLHRTCRGLAGAHDWQRLRREETFTTVAAETQTDTLPADFLRHIQGTFWNRTDRRPVIGPLTPQEWQYLKAQVTGGVEDQFYQRNNDLLIYPAPSAGETMAFEYITKMIGLATDNTTERELFTVDTDYTYFDDELVILGAAWSYKQSEGLDYSEEMNSFELRFYDMVKADGGISDRNAAGKMYQREIKPKFQEYISS